MKFIIRLLRLYKAAKKAQAAYRLYELDYCNEEYYQSFLVANSALMEAVENL